MAEALYLAMWSGPRNISTAMMRAWGQRPDTVVLDEPFYAFYLTRHSPGHPGEDEVKAVHENDWRKVAQSLSAPLPPGKRVSYQKHMAHHLLPEIDRSFLGRLTHAFLIRDPEAMLVSLGKHMQAPTLADTGLPQQVEVFETVKKAIGTAPPVIDAEDVLRDPRGILSQLCQAVGIEFQEAMLSWSPGRRESDGVWAKHWYSEVESSTGFRSPRERGERLPGSLALLHQRCQELYLHLHPYRLR